MSLEKQILQLRSQGLTYDQIAKELGCSKSTISYHCSPGQKEKNKARNRYNKRKDPIANKLNKFMERKPAEIESASPTSTIARRVYDKVNNFQRRIANSSKRLSKVDKSFSMNDVLALYGGSFATCYLTGDLIDLSAPDTYTFDHILPVARGGTNDISNLGIATKKANMAKSDLLLEDFLDLCEKILKNYDRL